MHSLAVLSDTSSSTDADESNATPVCVTKGCLGDFSDLDPLGQIIALRAIEQPASLGQISRYLQQYRDWYKGIVLATLREAKQMQQSLSHQHHTDAYQEAKQRIAALFHATPAFVGDHDVRNAAEMGPLDPEDPMDALRLYQNAGYAFPRYILPGSPPLRASVREIYTPHNQL